MSRCQAMIRTIIAYKLTVPILGPQKAYKIFAQTLSNCNTNECCIV
jgi:hypothetical protein